MNNLSSYCGLVDAKIRNSDKDLPVWKEAFFQFFLQKGKSRQFSALRNRLWSEVKQTSHGDNIFFPIHKTTTFHCEMVKFYNSFSLSVLWKPKINSTDSSKLLKTQE